METYLPQITLALPVCIYLLFPVSKHTHTAWMHWN